MTLSLGLRKCSLTEALRRIITFRSCLVLTTTPSSTLIMNSSQDGVKSSIPIFLLKTKSSPSDGYEEHFAAVQNYATFEPTFVPVLEHKFLIDGLRTLKEYLQNRTIGSEPEKQYGGLIFTSQRAVEAFASLLEEGRNSEQHWPHLQGFPIYTVGPATSRALRAISQKPPLCIFGEETGNGEALANFILDHYCQWYRDCKTLPPLLFPVGEQRRDIIPKTLMNPELGLGRRIQVDELVVYGTGVMESFEQDFMQEIEASRQSRIRWVVVFSPTGCESMLRALGMLDAESSKIKVRPDALTDRRTYIATIGPTTRDYLKYTFAFDPDVCAERPSPEGIEHGIRDFMLKMGHDNAIQG